MLFPSARTSPALLVVPLLWLAAWLVARRPLPPTPLALPLLLLALMLLVSEFATFDLAYSLPKIAGLVLGLGMFYALLYAARGGQGLGVGVGLFLAAGVGIAGLGLLGTRWFNKISFLQPILARLPAAIRGLPGAEAGFQPNEVAGALLWVLPVLLSLTFLAIPRKNPGEAPRRSRPAIFLGLLLLTAFVGGVFVLTQSRTAFIALALAFLGLPAVLLERKWRWVYGTVVAVLLVGLALTAWRMGWVQALYTSTTSTTAGTIQSADSLDTLNGRVIIWSHALTAIRDFPLTGLGMNVFRQAFYSMYAHFVDSPVFDIGHAHNEFLTAALDLGVPGLVAFLSLYLLSFWMLARAWSQHPGSAHTGEGGANHAFLASPVSIRIVVIGLGGGLLAHALYGLADTVALGAKPGILFWMLLGLVAGLYRLGEEKPSPALPATSPQPPPTNLHLTGGA